MVPTSNNTKIYLPTESNSDFGNYKINANESLYYIDSNQDTID